MSARELAGQLDDDLGWKIGRGEGRREHVHGLVDARLLKDPATHLAVIWAQSSAAVRACPLHCLAPVALALSESRPPTMAA